MFQRSDILLFISAQCLFVVSENNPEVTACIKTDEFLQLTDGGDATDTGATLLRTLVIGSSSFIFTICYVLKSS